MATVILAPGRITLPQIVPSPERSVPHLIHGVLGSIECTRQMAPWLVHPFLQGWWLWPTLQVDHTHLSVHSYAVTRGQSNLTKGRIVAQSQIGSSFHRGPLASYMETLAIVPQCHLANVQLTTFLTICNAFQWAGNSPKLPSSLGGGIRAHI